MPSYDIGKLVFQITGDTSGIDKSLKKADTGVKGLASSFLKATLAADAIKAALRAMGTILVDSVKKASDLQETTNKFDVVFGSTKDKAYEFAKVLQESYGLAKEESMSFLAGTGDILTGLGMQADAALDLSNSVAKLGIDLASFSNVEGGAERAIGALTSALTGEREALKAYGIVISEEMVKEELLSQGKSKLTGVALNQAKAEAVVAIALKQSGNAIGDMARSFDSYANIQRRINSRLDDMSASIGEKLLPSLSNLGLAFLSATEDGGFLGEAFNSIVGFIAETIDSIAILISYLDQLRTTSRVDELRESAKAERDLYYQREEATKGMSREGVRYAEALKQGLPWAVALYKENEKLRLSALEKTKTAINGHEEESKKIETLRKIQERQANKEKVNDANAEAISKRKKQRLNEETKITKDVQKEINDLRSSTFDFNLNFEKTESEKIALELENRKALFNKYKLNKKSDIDELAQYEINAKKRIKEAEQKEFAERLGIYNTYASQIGGAITGLLSAFQNLFDARAQADIDSLDAQMEAELEAAGVSEETTLEQAQREYDVAVAAGDANIVEEKRRALEKAKIEEKYQKKKKQMEYEAALQSWEFQRAIAALQIPLSIMNAVASGAQAPWFMQPWFMIGMGTIAGATAGAQYAAVEASKPQPPKFASGGIIPGSAQGTTITAGENNKTELVMNPDQMANTLMAIGNGAGAGGISQLPAMSADSLWKTIFQASQNGDLYIASRAVVNK